MKTPNPIANVSVNSWANYACITPDWAIGPELQNATTDFVDCALIVAFFVASKYGVSVVSLASTHTKPLIASDTAKVFKSAMHNRGLKRQSAHEQLAMASKRKFVKCQV